MDEMAFSQQSPSIDILQIVCTEEQFIMCSVRSIYRNVTMPVYLFTVLYHWEIL